MCRMRRYGKLTLMGLALLCFFGNVSGTQLLAAANPPSSLQMPQDPPTFGYRLVNAFGNLSFTDPLAIATPPGETNRVFVVEQAGRIAVITNLAAPTRTVFLDIASRILSGGEMGLLGLAFHPDYASNGQFYVFYSVNATSAQGSNTRHERLSRFQAAATDPNRADPASELILLEQRDEAENHNGGDLHFGPDGYLYVSLGDEGGGDDSYGNSQRIDKDFFSGLLRIDVDNRASSLPANPHPANTNNAAGEIRYRIPPDNPWVGATQFNGVEVDSDQVRTEFYAVGLRNPWRFTFDSVTGELYLGDVGERGYEEINLIRRGGNYGWNYREGRHSGPRQSPGGLQFDQPIIEYTHGTSTDQGNSVTGGLVYRGSRLPALFGAYIFADYVSGNLWMLRANGTNVVPYRRLAIDSSIAGFGVDPRNGDILTADQNDRAIKRLVEDTGVVTGTPLPSTLFDTGAFTNLLDLASEDQPLTPNNGVHPYEVNLPFWSDQARKTRWFFQPNRNQTFNFNPTTPWTFPTGTVWVKHFDLELTNGVAASAKRIETRLLVRNPSGIYGVTYRWGNSVTNAALVSEDGLDEEFTVYDGDVPRTQVWHYPSRNECRTCHSFASGYALGFTTAQLNREVDWGDGPTNQINALVTAGYLKSPISNLNLLPKLVSATNELWSREWRVRSYLAANCAQCHQPGGNGLGRWDGRLLTSLSQAGLVHGSLIDDGGEVDKRVIVPGSLSQSMLLSRISTRGPSQMPPLSTSLLDTQAIALVSTWITNDLIAYQTFPEWQTNRFGNPALPGAGPAEDPDSDGAQNFLEWLTGTDPNSPADLWTISVAREGDILRVIVPQLANRGFELQTATSLDPTASWQPLDVPANRPFISASNQLTVFEQPLTNNPSTFFRVRVFEP